MTKGKELPMHESLLTPKEQQIIKIIWERKLKSGQIDYDPEEKSLSKKLGIYTINFLPGRLKYLKDYPPKEMQKVSTPHDENDNFCTQMNEIEEQKIRDLRLRNHTWRMIANISPIEKYHCVLIPDGDPQNQTMTLPYFEDLAILAGSDKSFSLGFNSIGAAASQNHFHFHLFFNHWSRTTINAMPIKRRVFELKNIQGATEYTNQLVNQNTGHNITMSSKGIVITERQSEQIDGIKYGVDAISGRFLTTSPEQYENMNIDLINSILNKIAFPIETAS